MSEPIKWYKKAWAKYLAALLVISALSTGFTYLAKAVNWWNDHKQSYNDIKTLQINDSINTLKINNLVQYVEKKKEGGYAVGKRVKWITDEITGKRRKVKQFRDWGGIAHNITKDKELSYYYGRDYYFYTDEDDSVHYCP
jgi:hypothetical protein